MNLAAVAALLRGARRIAVLSGAGMSAESGVPTFRDAQSGLWSKFRPEELATEDAFRANPSMVWDWYAMRREMIAKVAPNAGHQAIAALQQREPGRLAVITQNVDGLHQRAGSTGVVALRTPRAPQRIRIASTCRLSASTAAGWPSSSTSSTAPASTGYPAA